MGRTLDKARHGTYNEAMGGAWPPAQNPAWCRGEEKERIMNHKNHHRVGCAVCALALLITVVCPTAAFAAEPEAETPQTLTASAVKEMQQTDAAVTALTDSDEYAEMDVEERQAAALEQLDALEQQGLVAKDSVYVDAESGMVSFSYPCGVLGGILLTDPDEEVIAGPDFTDADTALQTAAENGTVGSAVIYYAFDNGVNSSRYPYYNYMRNYWTSAGLDTTLDMMVTVSDLKKMADYDLCVFSTHGAYYTYQYGWLWKRQATEPILLLLEQSDFWNDLRYGADLLSHRIIKVNGAYAVTGDFFRAAYRGGKLKNTIVLSETCEFYGRSGHVDGSIANSLLAVGASAVAGYVNNVYAVYSRSMLWATVNRMIGGDTLDEAIRFSKNQYGEDDIVWYNNQNTGRRPHAMAAYTIISGDSKAQLVSPAEPDMPDTAGALRDSAPQADAA